MADGPVETRLLIGGERVEGAGEPLAVENPATEETLATVGTASPEQIDTAITAAGDAARRWEQTPAIERGEMLHEVARRLRDRQGELAAAMTAEGGKPLIENSDEIEWCAAAFELLRRDRPRLGRAGDPVDRGDPALDGGQGPDWRRRLHRPLELPAAADLEAGAGARRRQHHRLQALRADPDLDPDARRMPRAPAAGARQSDRRGR